MTQANRERLMGITIVEAPDHARGVKWSKKAEADAFLMDDVLLYGLAAARPDPKRAEGGGAIRHHQAFGHHAAKNDPVQKAGGRRNARLITSRDILSDLRQVVSAQPIPPRQGVEHTGQLFTLGLLEIPYRPGSVLNKMTAAAYCVEVTLPCLHDWHAWALPILFPSTWDLLKDLLAAAVTALAAGSVPWRNQRHTGQNQGLRLAVTLGCVSPPACPTPWAMAKYVGFHTEMAEVILADIQKQLAWPKLDIKYQPVTSQNRVPGDQRHRGSGVRLHHQQRRAPERRGVP